MRRLVLIVLLVLATLPAACGDDAEHEPDRVPQKRQHEILSERPSGFWTSNRPAEGGSYRWRLMGIGIVFIAITATGITLLIKSANREREARNAASKPDPRA